MTRDGHEVWAKRVERWRESGLTAKEFAAELGINANTLTHWGWRLRQDTERPKRRRRRGPVGSAKAAGWVEVVAGDATRSAIETVPVASAPAGAPSKAAWFEMVLGGGRVLRVPADFDDGALGRLLAVVEAR